MTTISEKAVENLLAGFGLEKDPLKVFDAYVANNGWTREGNRLYVRGKLIGTVDLDSIKHDERGLEFRAIPNQPLEYVEVNLELPKETQ